MAASKKHAYAALVFDLDGTLTESKSPLESAMSHVLCALLQSGKTIGVISGGAFAQFEKQLLAHFHCSDTHWSNLYLMPTSGASMYVWEQKGWREVYAHTITRDEYQRIRAVFDEVCTQTSFPRPEARWGEQLEYRGTQVTFSALGQDAPSAEKHAWHTNGGKEKKLELVRLLEPRLPEYHVRAGGSTSVDITHKGIDKAYGLEQFWKESAHTVHDTLFVGDALYEGGNDHAVVRTGVDTLAVDGPGDVLHILERMHREQS